MLTKEIRQQYRQRRRALSPRQQTRNARLLQQRLDSLLAFRSRLKIGAYLAEQGEISLDLWIATTRQRVFVPKLYEPLEPRLRFAELTPQTRWQHNRFGIAEPVAHWGQTVHPRQLDIVLVPLMAFDRQGNRLGMGGGYYDRSLAFRCARKHWVRPRLIGVAHSCQQHPSLPYQPWDVPLDLILTEQEVINPAQRRNN